MGNKIQADYSVIQEINIGLKEKDRKAVCRGLSGILADTSLLYLKTQNYHWNVTGPYFRQLHELFEEQYKELAAASDSIAERIRALGDFAPGSFSAFAKLSSIKEENGVPSAEEMIQNLLQGNEAIVARAREMVPLTEDFEDDVSAGLLVDRMEVHEKNAWMLRSLLPARHAH